MRLTPNAPRLFDQLFLGGLRRAAVGAAVASYAIGSWRITVRTEPAARSPTVSRRAKSRVVDGLPGPPVVAEPLKDAEASQRIPTAGLTRLLHIEVHRARMGSGDPPGSALVTFLDENLDRIAHPLVIGNAGATEIVECPQDIEAPAVGVSEL